MAEPIEFAKLAAAMERSRTVSLIAMAFLVVAAIPLLAVLIGTVGFEPVPILSVVAALGIGIAFLAWHRRRMTLMVGLMRIADAHKDELIGLIDKSS